MTDELIVTDESTDVVAEGYDAGVRMGEVIDQDMITVPVSDPLRLVVVGSPKYFAGRPAPAHPRELVSHVCINWRDGPGAVPYRWEFHEKGHDFSIAVDARVVTNDVAVTRRLALAGVGLAIGFEQAFQRGELVAVLEEFSTPFPGHYLYYPARRQASPALRALIDYLLRLRQSIRPAP